MTTQAFSTIALLMSVCIMWGMILTTIFNRKYVKKLQERIRKRKPAADSETWP